MCGILGSTIDAKTYPDVTMLFSDIVGFTSICSRATPFMVISMLEELYKEFDEICGYFDVYKVETIGDAYCVASGLHRPSQFDAHKVAWMALRMIRSCSNHITHDGEPIAVSCTVILDIAWERFVHGAFFSIFRCESDYIRVLYWLEWLVVKCRDIACSATM